MSIANLVQWLQDRPATPPEAAPEPGQSVRTVAPGANTIFQAVRTRKPAPMLAIRPVFAPVAPFAPETARVQSAGEESAPAGLLATALRGCKGCQHYGRRGTCLEPVRAGLIPHDDGYGIVWPEPGHGATCPARLARVAP